MNACVQIFQQRDLHGISSMLKSPNTFIIPKMLIYVQTKDMAWKVYIHLQRQCVTGIYHANITQTTKAAVYREFRSSGSPLKCLIATVAFGMVCGKKLKSIM